ncbi:unnamed protein product, partial [Phaeothamnion confervicola]
LQTVDQYYWGANNTIQHAGVRYILDSVVSSLLANPARRFIYAEQAFLWRWWRQQDAKMRRNVKELVRTGRLSFVNGGWVMNDEAAAHYAAMIDQTTLGHRFIAATFGAAALPSVGWQIDPFGHSATQASLLGGAAGFDALFFGRIDYADRARRLADRSLEMVWRSSPSLGRAAEIFAGAFQSGNYGPPAGYCFDVVCTDEPVMDDPAMDDYNAPERAAALVEAALGQAAHTRGRHVMLTMGSDFCYESGAHWFDNIEKLLPLVNADSRVNMFYSTPAAYVAAKHAERLDWGPPKTDDFFPYSDCPHCYWTGYFSSRPALKRLERVSSAYLSAFRQLQFLGSAAGLVCASGGDPSSFGGDGGGAGGSSSLPDGMPSGLRTLERAQALMQHHDGVSGTSKQHVAYDYARRIAAGIAEAVQVAGPALAALAGVGASASAAGRNLQDRGMQWCLLANESRCDATENIHSGGGSVEVVVYNPLGDDREEVILLPVGPADLVAVMDAEGATVPSQLLVLPPRPPPPSAPHEALGTSGASEPPRHAMAVAFPVRVTALGTAVYTLRAVDSVPSTASEAGTTALPEDGSVARQLRGPLLSAMETATKTPAAGATASPVAAATAREAQRPPTTVGMAPSVHRPSAGAADFTIENDFMQLVFSGESGRLVGVWRTFPDGGSSAYVALDQGFAYYEAYDATRHSPPGSAAAIAAAAATAAAPGAPSAHRHPELSERLGASAEVQNEGAYILRPAAQTALAVGASSAGGAKNCQGGMAVEWTVQVGPIVSEVRQTFSSWLSQVIRLRRGQAHAEFEWSVGPIPADDGVGKDVVSRFSSAVASAGTFWTDSNGREFQRRQRDARPTWPLDVTEPVAGNYYPATVGAFLRDDPAAAVVPLQLTVLTDRAQGAASLADGALELMLHRRVLADDDRGVGEPLNETDAGI